MIPVTEEANMSNKKVDARNILSINEMEEKLYSKINVEGKRLVQ